MAFIDPANLASLSDRANADPEFRQAGRYWTGIVQVAIGEESFVIKVVDGVVQSQHGPADANDWPVALNYDIRLSAPVEEWEKFFDPDPELFYHELFAAVTRQFISLGGDIGMWYAYYAAVRRLINLLREANHAKAEV
ncbi:hypothetical protein AB0F77_22580 [Streptomyces sp. NPDC026672]|uniref:hypothetical protein n=1 Tax=unclassified Streptomyces TaxID=2593676 RepID=UPI00340D792B